MKTNAYGSLAGLLILFCAATDLGAQDFDDEPRPPWAEALRNLRYNFCDPGMTQIDPKGPPVLVKSEQTAKGTTLETFSDGSTKEFRRRSKTMLETRADGTKIETIVHDNQGNRTVVVLRPSRHGYIRYADGKGSKIEPDGTITDVRGTIEVLPGGVVQQTLADEDVILHHYPDGTTKSRPDLVKEMKAQGTWTISQAGGVVSRGVPGQILIESTILQQVQLCNDSVLGSLLRSDAENAGVPRPLAEVAAAPEKRPGLFESLAPLIPSIGIGIGGGRGGERDRGERDRR